MQQAHVLSELEYWPRAGPDRRPAMDGGHAGEPPGPPRHMIRVTETGIHRFDYDPNQNVSFDFGRVYLMGHP